MNLSPGKNRIIQEDFEYPDVTIEPGDGVFADFTFAHNDVRLYRGDWKRIPLTSLK